MTRSWTDVPGSARRRAGAEWRRDEEGVLHRCDGAALTERVVVRCVNAEALR